MKYKLFILLLFLISNIAFSQNQLIDIHLIPDKIISDSIPEEIILSVVNQSFDTLLYINDNIIIMNNQTMENIIYLIHSGYNPTCLYILKKKKYANEVDAINRTLFNNIPKMLIIYPNEEKIFRIKLPVDYKNILKLSNIWKLTISLNFAVKSKIDYLIALLLEDRYKYYKNNLSTGNDILINENSRDDSLEIANKFTECEKQIFAKILNEFDIYLFSK